MMWSLQGARRSAAAAGLVLALVAAPAVRADQTGIMTLPGDSCSTPLQGSWSEGERWAWDKICTGHIANMVEFAGGSEDAASDDPWPEGRDLSLRFLEAILLTEPYRSAVPIGGVRIQGAHFSELVDLSNASLVRELWLDKSRFDKGADYLALRSTGLLSMDESRFDGPIDMERSQIDGSIFMRDASIRQGLKIIATRVGSTVDLKRSTIANGLDFERLSTGGGVFLSEIEESGDLNMLGAHIGDTLEFSGAHIGGDAKLQRMTLGSDMFAKLSKDKQTRFDGELDMLGSNFGGGVELTGMTIAGQLIFEDAVLGGKLWLTGEGKIRARFANIDLLGARIGSSVYLNNADFTNGATFEDAHVGQSIEIGDNATFTGTFTFNRTRVDADIRIRNSEFTGNVEMRAVQVADNLEMGEGAKFDGTLDLAFARISANLDLTDGTYGAIDLTGAMIGSEIRLGSPDQQHPTWHAPDKITLRNVTAGALQDLPKSWPHEIDLEGFTYSRLGGIGTSGSMLATRETSDFTAWLEKQKEFSPQSYMQLATVLRSSGYPDKADWILFKGKLREFELARWDQKLFLGLYCITTGFGIYPQLAALWVLFLVALGTYIFGHDKQPALVKASWVDRAIYSLDMLIPVIHLRKAHYEFEPVSNRARYYLYFHRFAGFLLASVLVASLTHGGVELHG